MTKVHDERFIDVLIGMLGERATRPQAREALVAHGAPALERLAESFADSSLNAAIRTHLPRTVSRFGTQQAADILVERLQQEAAGLVRYKILRGLGGLVTRHSVRVNREIAETQICSNLKEYLKLFAYHWAIRPDVVSESDEAAKVGEPLRGLLIDKMEQALERALRLLQLLHRRENLRSVTRALRSGDGTQRARALEFLDALTLAHRSDVRRLVTLIVDDMEPAERVSRAREFVGEPPGARQALIELSRDEDAAVAEITRHYLRRLGSLPPAPPPQGTVELLPGFDLARREPRLA
jgi:HEAT repeat protein